MWTRGHSRVCGATQCVRGQEGEKSRALSEVHPTYCLYTLCTGLYFQSKVFLHTLRL